LEVEAREHCGPLSLTLSPLRGARASSCDDPCADDRSGAHHLIDLVRLSVGIRQP